MKGRPQWVHDCSRCVFLGRHIVAGFGEYDLYFCNQGTPGGKYTVLARYGSAPHENMSGIFVAVGLKETHPEHPLVQAYNLAIKEGFLK